MNDTTFFYQRLSGFMQQVYEPLLHVVFSALWFFALSGFLLIVSGTDAALSIDAQSMTAVATLFLVLFYLRVVDEIKDVDYDRLHNPDRPLISGQVSVGDLKKALIGLALVTVLLNLVFLGGVLALIVALDMAYGLFLVNLEKNVPAVADGMFLNLAVTYPVNMALSVYVFVFCAQDSGVSVSVQTLAALFVFILAFLHHEIGRKTCWPQKVSEGKRHYSSEIGGKGSAFLAGAAALFATLGVFLLLSPWQGSGLGGFTGLLILLPLAPALVGVYRFLATEHQEGPEAPMTFFAMIFLLLFYVTLIVYTLAVCGLSVSMGGGLILVAGGMAWGIRSWWGKDISMPGSLYIHSTESLIQGNDMLLTAVFKEPLDPERVCAAYEKMVLDYPALQSRWMFDEKKKRYLWTTFSVGELSDLLAFEKQHLLSYHSLDDIYGTFVPTNTRLPIRISLIDETRAVFAVNHVFSNGLNLFKWMEILLAIYHGEAGAIRPNRLNRKQRLGTYLSVFYAGRYIASFMKNCGKTYKDDTLDFSNGQTPGPSENGYGVKTYSFSESRTREIVKQAAEKDNTVSEYLCATLAQALFDAVPGKSRISLSAPTDLLWCIPDTTLETRGNHTGSLMVQLNRGSDLHKQAKDVFRHFTTLVPFGIAKIMNLFFVSHRKLEAHFLAQARKPFKDRGAFEFYTLAFSSAGVIRLPLIQKYVESCSGHTRNQTIFIGLLTLNGRLAVEVCVDKGLYDVDEVFGVFDRVFQ